MNNTDLPRKLLEQDSPFIPALRKAIGCPIDWSTTTTVSKHPALANDLRIYWAKVAEEFQSDREINWYSRNVIAENSLNETLLREIEINASIWRDRAKAEYERRVGFLRNLYFAGWDKYPKHRPPPRKSPKQIASLTANGGVSLFFSYTAIQHCETLLWESITDNLINIVTNRPDHIFVESLRDIGACEGQPCKVLRVDLNYSNSEAHGHPHHLSAGEQLLGVSYAKELFSPEDQQKYSYNIDLPAVKHADDFVEFICNRH